MAIKISGISYPDDSTAILADGTLKNAFHAFAKRTMVNENTAFLQAVAARFDPKLLYAGFFSTNGNMSINIPGTMRAEAEALANQQPPDWRDNSWAGVIQKAKREIANMLNLHSLPLFWKSPEFLAIHEPAVRSQIKGLDKATKLLGIKNTRTLEELLFQIRLNGADSAGAKAASDKLAKEEKLSMQRDALLKALKSGGFL